MNKLRQDIRILIEIHQEIEKNYDDNEWELCEHHIDEIMRITDCPDHDWDENVLAHYITGMQRAIQLMEIYENER